LANDSLKEAKMKRQDLMIGACVTALALAALMPASVAGGCHAGTKNGLRKGRGTSQGRAQG
jgi:hypothetical protein